MSDNPFNIIGNAEAPKESGIAINATDIQGDLKERIEKIIGSSKIVLFMKGIPQFPQCGFSANTVGILNSLGANFNTFDILSDQDIRQGLKEYSNWPTFPQLYVNGKLVGGNDIITELHESGELNNLLK